MKILITLLFIFSSFISFSQTTSLTMQSEQGDYIGQGQNYNFSESDGTFQAYYYDHNDTVRITFSGDDGLFSINFAAMETKNLIVGPYIEATRFSFQSPTKPGFSATGFGRGCNESFSEFDILELEILEGEVAKFAADFEQHCGSIDNPKLTGRISFQSDGAPFPAIPDSDNDSIYDTLDNCINVANPNQENADLDLLGDACDDYYTNTHLVLDSEEGDYIGQGEYRSFYLIDGNMEAERNFDNGVTVRYDGENPWTLNFAAPGDVELSNGFYDMATRYPFQDASEPGLSISGDGRGCNTLSGSFDVHSVIFDAQGEVEYFDASYTQYCGASQAALTGRVTVDQRSDLIFASTFED